MCRRTAPRTEHHTQTEAATQTIRLGHEERLEYTAAYLFRHAEAGLADGDADFLTRRPLGGTFSGRRSGRPAVSAIVSRTPWHGGAAFRPDSAKRRQLVAMTEVPPSSHPGASRCRSPRRRAFQKPERIQDEPMDSIGSAFDGDSRANANSRCTSFDRAASPAAPRRSIPARGDAARRRSLDEFEAALDHRQQILKSWAMPASVAQPPPSSGPRQRHLRCLAPAHFPSGLRRALGDAGLEFSICPHQLLLGR